MKSIYKVVDGSLVSRTVDYLAIENFIIPVKDEEVKEFAMKEKLHIYNGELYASAVLEDNELRPVLSTEDEVIEFVEEYIQANRFKNGVICSNIENGMVTLYESDQEFDDKLFSINFVGLSDLKEFLKSLY